MTEDKWLKTTCYGCPAATCGMLAHKVDGVVTEVKGDPDCPFSQGKLCAKGHAQIMMSNSHRRVTKPMRRTNPEKGLDVDPGWEEISYEEAIRIAGQHIKQCHDTDPSGLVLGCTDFTTLYWFSGAALGSFGSTNFNTAGKTFCGNNVHPFLQQVHGGFHAGPDFHHCNYVLLMGSNKGAVGNWAAVTATVEMAEARRRGMKVVVVDPWCSHSAAVADEWVPIRPGTDGALLLAMENLLVNELGLYDEEFLRTLSNAPYLVNTESGRYIRDEGSNKPLLWDSGDQSAKCYDDPTLSVAAMAGDYEVQGQPCQPVFVKLKAHLAQFTPEWAEGITTIPRDTIRRLAKEFGSAASIGSTIEYEGETLPLRPACAHWYKGLSQHAGGHEQGLAISLLNTLVGAIDVPGGLSADSVYVHHPRYSENSTWLGKESGLREQDGLLIANRVATYADTFPAPYPPREVTEPTNMAADNFALPGIYMSGLLPKLNVLHPEQFKNKIPHNPKVYVQIVSNDVMNEGNPKTQADYHKKFDFQLSIVPHIDETAAFADIVIPTQTQLERLDMGANNIPDTMGSTATGDCCINLRQPVFDTPYKHFVDIWIDIAEQSGTLPAFNEMVNFLMEMNQDFVMEADRKYTHKEITERWIGSMTGGEMTLADVARAGNIHWKKTAKERYPRAFYKSRIPVYYEYFIEEGEKLKAVTEKMGMDWDVSRYKAMPDWVPGPGYKTHVADFDLYAVTFKWPFLTGSFSNYNSWLGELRQYHPYTGKIVLNRQYAQSKGIEDGDHIQLENVNGRTVKGTVKLSECIHPECVGMDHSAGGWGKMLPPRPSKAKTGPHPGTLFDYELKNLDVMSGAFDASPKLKVSLAS